jgi:hypothetical protein
MRLRLASACLFAALLTAPAGAQSVADDAPAWVFLSGSWTCTFSNLSTPVTITYARKNAGTYTQQISAQLPNGTTYNENGWIGYDGSAKRWVYLADGDVGDYSVATSPGWKEGVLVFTGVISSDGDRDKSTLKRVNDTTIDSTVVSASGTTTQHCVKK